MLLLLRDRRTVRLTAAGETFRREALEILHRNQEAIRLTKRASLGEVGQLRIGFFGSATAAFLPALVQEYHRRFPDVELTLLELTATQQLEAFDRGQLDVGFSRPLPAEPSREFHEELVYTDYLHLVLAAVHPLARNLVGGGTIAIKRLSGERFVLLHRQGAPEVCDEVLALCRRAGNFSPHVVNEPDRMSTVLLLVESGIGVSIVAGSVRHLVRAGGRLSILPVAAPFRAHRVAIELAAERAIVAHGRSFSRTRAEPAGGDPCIDGGKTLRKETAAGAQAVTRCFLIKRSVRRRRGARKNRRWGIARG